MLAVKFVVFVSSLAQVEPTVQHVLDGVGGEYAIFAGFIALPVEPVGDGPVGLAPRPALKHPKDGSTFGFYNFRDTTRD